MRFLCPWNFSGRNLRNGLPFPTPGSLPDPGIEPRSPVLADGFFTTEPPVKPETKAGGRQFCLSVGNRFCSTSHLHFEVISEWASSFMRRVFCLTPRLESHLEFVPFLHSLSFENEVQV